MLKTMQSHHNNLRQTQYERVRYTTCVEQGMWFHNLYGPVQACVRSTSGWKEPAGKRSMESFRVPSPQDKPCKPTTVLVYTRKVRYYKRMTVLDRGRPLARHSH